MIQFPSKTVWDTVFPSFWIWLYGRRMRQTGAYQLLPADALRQIDQAIVYMLPPTSWLDKIIAIFALRKLRAMRTEWERLVEMNIVVMGYTVTVKPLDMSVSVPTSTVPKEEQL
jgi:hypothetical protein